MTVENVFIFMMQNMPHFTLPLVNDIATTFLKGNVYHGHF